MSALSGLQLEHLTAGALLAGGGVLATLPTPGARRWWPTSGAAAVYFVTAATGVAPLLPHRAGLILSFLVLGAAVGWLTTDSARVLRHWHAPSWLVAALLGASALGITAAVPDTEVALRSVGCLAALGALALVAPLARVPEGPPAVWAAPAVLVVWSAAVGATGRPAAFLGTVACFGVLVSLPLAVRLVRAIAGPDARVWWPVVLVVQIPLAIFGGRETGLERAVGPATLPAAGALLALVGFFATWLLASGWWARRRARSDEAASAR